MQAVFAYLVLILPLSRFVFGFHIYFGFSVVVFVCLMFVFILKRGIINIYLLSFSFLILAMFLFGALRGGESFELVFYPFNSLFLLGLAYWFSGLSSVSQDKCGKYALITYLVIFLVLGVNEGFSPQNINEFYEGSSRNVVSAVGIYYLIIYSVSMISLRDKSPVIFSFIILVVCIICFGRAGIFFGFLVFSFSVFYNLFISSSNSKRNKLLLSVLAAAAFIVFSYVYFSDLLESLLGLTNFSKGVESPRSDMVRDYLQFLGFYEFLMGVDLKAIPIFNEYSGNPHNSYILGHSSYGFFYLLFIFLLILCCLFFQINSRQFYLSFLLFFWLGRIFFDILSLMYYLDFVVYYIFWASYRGQRRNAVNKCPRLAIPNPLSSTR